MLNGVLPCRLVCAYLFLQQTNIFLPPPNTKIWTLSDIYATKFGEHILVNVTYMDANNERHIAVSRRFRYSNAEVIVPFIPERNRTSPRLMFSYYCDGKM